jgi:uncharacterized protein
VAELLRRPSSRLSVRRSVPLDGATVVDSHLAEGAEADVDLELESLADGIVVTGTISAPWEGSCRRCLAPVGGRAEAVVRELFHSAPTTDEARPLAGEQIDLEPLVREAVMLELPLAPLCRPDCAGLCPECGADRNVVDCGHRPDTRDPRWAALEGLLDDGELGTN